jgi:transposase InsO family protein
MSRKANPYDNAMMESFFAALKTECFQNLAVPIPTGIRKQLHWN